MAKSVLVMVAIGGARTLGIQDKIGTIKDGMRSSLKKHNGAIVYWVRVVNL